MQMNPNSHPPAVSDGIQRVIDHARALRDDAQYLLTDHRYRAAAALTILAIEEVGKVVDRVFFDSRSNEDRSTKQRRTWHQNKQIALSKVIFIAAIARAFDSKLVMRDGVPRIEWAETRPIKPLLPTSPDPFEAMKQLVLHVIEAIKSSAADEDSPVWNEVDDLLEASEPLSEAKYDAVKNAALYEELEHGSQIDFRKLAPSLMKSADVVFELLDSLYPR
jgi:AbiV family abortive infection protein